MQAGGVERTELCLFSNISYTEYVINCEGDCCFNFKTENPIDKKVWNEFLSTILSAGAGVPEALTVSWGTRPSEI